MESVTTQLLNSTKELVTYIKKSGLASMLSSSVIQECLTRWNSKLALLMSEQKNFREIESLLKEKGEELRLQGIDLMLMNKWIQFLLPFKLISDAMEGSKYPTIHGVLLRRKKLLDHCKCFETDLSVIKIIKKKFRV